MSELYYGYKEESKIFFDIIMEGLKGEVDDGSFWDAVDKDAVFEFCYNSPGIVNKIEGRDEYLKWFLDYSTHLYKADGLRVYKDKEAGVVILEYIVYGTHPKAKREYHNHFCSIITIKNRKITHWRDYCDTLEFSLFSNSIEK